MLTDEDIRLIRREIAISGQIQELTGQDRYQKKRLKILGVFGDVLEDLNKKECIHLEVRKAIDIYRLEKEGDFI